MAKTVKCSYSHCPHNHVISSDDYVTQNGKYYHRECRKELDTINEIKKVWYEQVDNDSKVFPHLTRTLNDIIYNKNISAEFVLFALKDKAKYIKHPGGLYYLIKDDRLKRKWEQLVSMKIVSSEEFKRIEIKGAEEPEFTSNGRRDASFGDIFGGY